MLTAKLVASVFGPGRGDGALLAVPLIPAAALADGVTAGVRALGRLVRLARRAAAGVLRDVAEVLDPAPVVLPTVEYVFVERPAPAPVEAPAVLPLPVPMPSAAQVTAPDYPDGVDYAATVKACGSQRAAAKHLGIPISTLRGRLKKQRS